jgi:hypothetical protein
VQGAGCAGGGGAPGQGLQQLARRTMARGVEAKRHDEGLSLELSDEGGGAVHVDTGTGVADEGGAEDGRRLTRGCKLRGAVRNS